MQLHRDWGTQKKVSTSFSIQHERWTWQESQIKCIKKPTNKSGSLAKPLLGSSHHIIWTELKHPRKETKLEGKLLSDWITRTARCRCDSSKDSCYHLYIIMYDIWLNLSTTLEVCLVQEKALNTEEHVFFLQYNTYRTRQAWLTGEEHPTYRQISAERS